MSSLWCYRGTTVLAVLLACALFTVAPSTIAAVLCVLGVYTVSWYMEEGVRAGTRVQCVGRTVLVTGCDTGFGHALAKQLATMDVTVFAGCLRSSGDGATALRTHHPTRLHVLQMDVTDAKQIQECVKYVNEHTRDQGLWGLVNNAGLNFLGDVELTTMEQFERVCNINQLGMVRVTKAFLPLIRRQQGRIVNVTSVKGRLSSMFDAAYCMTKFAGETFSDILRLEMAKFGVGVSVVQPCHFGGATAGLEIRRIQGDFDTMWTELPDEARQVYGEDYVRRQQPLAAVAVIPGACLDISLVTNAMVDALFTVQPKTRYLIGGTNGWYDPYKLYAQLAVVLPDWLMDRLTLWNPDAFPSPQALTGKNKQR